MIFIRKTYIFLLFALITTLDFVLGFYDRIVMGLPPFPISSWTAYQWDMFHFFWDPALSETLIYLVVLVLALRKRFVVFPLSMIILLHPLKAGMYNLKQVYMLGFIYPVANTIGVLVCLEFIYSAFGTILWYRNIRYHGGKWWQ